MTPRLNIRTRLLVLLLAALLAGVLISAALTYFIALHVATMAYDRALIDPALAMAPHLSLDENGQMKFDLPRIAQQVLLIDSKDEMFFRILDSQGRTIAGESDLPAARAGIHEVSYFDSMIHGRPIRVVALPVPLTAAGAKGPMAVVEAAETTAKRQHLIREVLLANLVPSLMLATLTMVLVWFGVAWGLVPLNRLRQDLAMRSHRDLRPVPVDRSPEETRPLVEAINDLLLRLREAIGVQQRFIANAAHQLRTPLAAMLTQAELLDRSGLPAQQQHELTQLHRAVGKAARLAAQLLTLARAEPGERGSVALVPLDLEPLCEELVQEWVPRAHERDMDLGFELEPARVAGDATLLRELIRNLLDNALKYTQAGGTVTLRLKGAEHPVIEVEDNGPGIPVDERERVLERFHRLDGSPGEGSGLGLAIVREIAMTHDAQLKIAAPADGNGTLISVRFPRLAS